MECPNCRGRFRPTNMRAKTGGLTTLVQIRGVSYSKHVCDHCFCVVFLCES